MSIMDWVDALVVKQENVYRAQQISTRIGTPLKVTWNQSVDAGSVVRSTVQESTIIGKMYSMLSTDTGI